MEIDNLPILGTTVDKSQVPPIHQKRILAFVNHFITSTCKFLNDFILSCENKFIDIERKIQRVEASLIIIESKIASIPNLDQTQSPAKQDGKEVPQPEEPSATDGVHEAVEGTDSPADNQETTAENEDQVQGVTASNDARYRKYFKMILFGVPPGAVKMKMAAEGYDPDILDTPDKILPDGIQHEPAEE